MRLTSPLLCLLSASALLLFTGCDRIKEERRHRLLEHNTSQYRQALRWGYYDAAMQFVQPEKRQDALPQKLENIRLTGYEVIQPPVIVSEDKAHQIVRIEYVLRDRQRVDSLTERQEWVYDKTESRWWLASGLPAFPTEN